jgi:hypothetical protein
LAPDYKESWNDRQKTVAEELPFRYLTRLLPTARTFRPVYYRWKIGNGPAKWYEADGLLIYDDHLFVIEVKAGAFTYTSPATDLAAHLASMRNLIVSPANQGARFLDYLDSASEVPIFDAAHSEVARLQRSTFRHVTICAVTLDAFTETAARAPQLRKVGIDVGNRSVWPLSIDDLRVYADVFANPLVFLHFVEQRMRAAASELVDAADEMDHLGLYLAKNDYRMFAENLMGSSGGKLLLSGSRRPIDDYYNAIVAGTPPVLPVQKMPTRWGEIGEMLAGSDNQGRSRIASFLLDVPPAHRAVIARAIDQQLQEHKTLSRNYARSTHREHRFTLFVSSPASPRNAANALQHTHAIVAATREESRLLIELEYSSDGMLTDLHWQDVTLAGLTAADLARVQHEGGDLRRKRVAAARAAGKIGANQECPCGSGKKFKRCCRSETA